MIGRIVNGIDLSGVSVLQIVAPWEVCLEIKGSAKLTERPKRMAFSGSGSTWIAFVVDEAGCESREFRPSGATLL